MEMEAVSGLVKYGVIANGKSDGGVYNNSYCDSVLGPT